MGAIRFVFSCAVVALASTWLTPAAAQSWPSRPVRIIVPFAPGGGVDFVTRLLAAKLSESLGVQFITENRAGGAGVIAAELVAKAPPDGYTLLTTAPEFSINPAVRKKLSYDPLKDFVFISQLTSGQFMLARHPSVPAATIKELVALAKSRPERITYGTSGAGGINHLAGELLQSMAGIRMIHVPFKGAGPATIGLISGEVDLSFSSTTALLGPVQSKRVFAVAVTGPKRFAALPQVPTIAESGYPEYSVTGWYGFYAPGGTSADIVRRLNAEVVRAFGNSEVRERLMAAGNEPVASTPEAFGAFVRGEIAKWTKVAKQTGMQVD